MSRPTVSMSTVRNTFWQIVVSGAGGVLAGREVRHLGLHSGADEERRAVVGARDERGGGTPEVSLLLGESLREALAQLGSREHGGHSLGVRSPAEVGATLGGGVARRAHPG